MRMCLRSCLLGIFTFLLPLIDVGTARMVARADAASLDRPAGPSSLAEQRLAAFFHQMKARRPRPQLLVLSVQHEDGSRLVGRRLLPAGDLEYAVRLERAPPDEIPNVSLQIGRRDRFAAPGDDTFKSIEHILPNLDAAPKVLPPMHRRLVVAFPRSDEWEARTFDRAALSPGVLRLLRLIDPDDSLGAWCFIVPPSNRRVFTQKAKPFAGMARFDFLSGSGEFLWGRSGGDILLADAATGDLRHSFRSEDFHAMPAFRVTRGGRWLLLSDSNEKHSVHVIDLSTRAKFTTLALPREEGLLMSAESSDDGKRIFLATSGRIFEYDSSDWKENRPAAMKLPKSTKRSLFSPGGHRVLLVSAEGASEILDRTSGDSKVKAIGRIGAEHLAGTFSPDGAKLAIMSLDPDDGKGSKRAVRLDIWDAKSAQPLCELLPYDLRWAPYANRLSIQWTEDGEYLVASGQPRTGLANGVIHLWNARTGRHRADFVGPTAALLGIGLDQFTQQLFAGSEDGSLWTWDFGATRRKVHALESSLERNAKE